MKMLHYIFSNTKQALINHACEVHDFDGVPNYWHSSNGNDNQVLLYDQGRKKTFSKVVLRNSGNSRFNNVYVRVPLTFS